MQVVLVMFRGDGERRSFSVARNMTVIGRREDCDLRIPLGDVSRKHCRLVRTDEGIRIEDLGSSHGTTVNGQPIREMELSPGDTIGVGPVSFVVQIDGVPADSDIISPERRAALAAVAADDSSAGHHHSAIAAGHDLADEEEFPLDEMSPDEAPLEHAPLEEASLEDVPLEAATPELAPLEELPLEEAVLEEEPLDGATLEEVPMEVAVLAAGHSPDQLSIEEVPLEEVVEHGADATSLEEVSMEELVSEAGDKTVDPTEIEAIEMEEFKAPTTAGAVADDLEDLDWMEEISPPPPPPPLPPSLAAAAPAPPIPPAAIDPEADFEFVLEEATHEPPTAAGSHVDPTPVETAKAGDGDWDFVVEETEAEHAPEELHIDFEESHHGQSHT